MKRGKALLRALAGHLLAAVVRTWIPPEDPEATALHKELRENKKTFLEALRARTAHGLPRYAEEELSGSLRCGVLAHGFARVRCAECGHSARA